MKQYKCISFIRIPLLEIVTWYSKVRKMEHERGKACVPETRKVLLTSPQNGGLSKRKLSER